MSHWFLRLSILVSIVGSFAAQTADWHEYRNLGGNFSVLMPAEPTETTEVFNGKTTHTIPAVVNGVGYSVIYTNVVKEQTVDEARYKTYRDDFLKLLPFCVVSSEQAAAPAIQNYIGRWYRLDCVVSNTKVSYVGNLYWGKHYRYVVMVLFGSGPSDAPDTKKFVNSFSVIDSTK
jgi:hypothetical protein